MSLKLTAPDYLEELYEKWPRLASKYAGPTSDDTEIEDNVRIHCGLITSGNQVIKDADFRDRVDQTFGGQLLSVRDGSGWAAEVFPVSGHPFLCLVIRGICNFADARKNYNWQEYAAVVAAAFTKELLGFVQPTVVVGERSAKDILSSGQFRLGGSSG